MGTRNFYIESWLFQTFGYDGPFYKALKRGVNKEKIKMGASRREKSDTCKYKQQHLKKQGILMNCVPNLLSKLVESETCYNYLKNLYMED